MADKQHPHHLPMGLTGWHLILLVVMITGWVGTYASSRTHTSDMEQQTAKDIERIEQRVGVLETKFQDTQIDLTRMAADIHRIDERLDAVEAALTKMDDKLDRLISGLLE